ncbi:hypothetical protein PTNB73_05100 [Pyrenophora teres f. teres]|uniref:RING-type domain-containing protein n=2 Tax=Pyrenophora teres f. teres TaxID=97479 RepID=E3RLJ4_PYRTT|nr:hypothetical protein PTT_09242 [Pyrenophora teres f. teres 0-1]KAE8833512.1 hypothetical protein HRS9139_05331 [Pyrenophora teres f. teres]KAE8840719.1 hypothetical protein PTNB85_04118 [Pyrenophora teres f. teres]KAE8849142.1 hypothetical protein HRS9122_03158 [Pyrenophora teres f. teres]KAE8864215.1 hypothetical protein PTNB29_04179 [Pyrenophora teres f. teres]
MANTALWSRQQDDILNPPPQCNGCITKSQNPPIFPFSALGPIYALRGCNHYMCRSCLTAQYTQDGDLQTFCVYNNQADPLILQDINPYLSLDYVADIRLLEIFNADSPLYAGNTAISINPAVASTVFAVVYAQTLEIPPLSIDTLPAEYLASRIRIYINNWSPHYLITPHLAVSELQVHLQDLFWTHMVRIPGAKYQHLNGMFGDNREAEFRGQYPLMMAMRKTDPWLKAAYSAWDNCLYRWGGVLAAWWWDVFRVENGWDVVGVVEAANG